MFGHFLEHDSDRLAMSLTLLVVVFWRALALFSCVTVARLVQSAHLRQTELSPELSTFVALCAVRAFISLLTMYV